MKQYRITNYSNRDLVDLQTNINEFFQQFYVNPILSGNLIKNVRLTAGVDNLVNHMLGVPASGWFVVRKDAVGDIYELPTTLASIQLNLHTTASCTVSLYIF